MEIKSNIDPVLIIESAFSSLFYRLFHDEGARKYFGFSQISAFGNEEDMPVWYLWVEGTNGCFELELIEGSLLYTKDQQRDVCTSKAPVIRGRFAIRYYPSENEDNFETYSYFEKLIRLGPLFDHTGTPTLKGRDQIHESYFIVGHIDVRTNVDRDFLELQCFAPERWEDFRVDGLYLKTPNQDDYEALTPGEQDRSVLGWKLSSFLFDKIISGFCYMFKVSPLAVFLSREKGFSFYIDEENRVTKRKNPDLKQFRLICGLGLEKEDSNPYREDKHLALYVQNVCNRLNQEKSDIMGIWKRDEDIIGLWINPDWWKAKEMEFVEDNNLHCTCYENH